MTVRDDKFGRIAVSQAAIASLVAEAVKECYGVVGMSSRRRLDELTGPLQRGGRKGVEINEGLGGVVVDIYIVVEYGMRISEVAAGVMRRVHFTLTEGAGIPVQAVNVHVQGLRVSDGGNAQPS
ncbi:MAG TPA: Asp23/Gls24 family envelope stress response protein [Anaerolineae bacterium]|nr:Asp23/Gls24 family envelope stress response protein [Anaerolineae bacterium]HNU04205.1 Asp23/Gls24 family envelope stress response protein [Anaerolineae bacterium]